MLDLRNYEDIYREKEDTEMARIFGELSDAVDATTKAVNGAVDTTTKAVNNAVGVVTSPPALTNEQLSLLKTTVELMYYLVPMIVAILVSVLIDQPALATAFGMFTLALCFFYLRVCGKTVPSLVKLNPILALYGVCSSLALGILSLSIMVINLF